MNSWYLLNITSPIISAILELDWQVFGPEGRKCRGYNLLRKDEGFGIFSSLDYIIFNSNILGDYYRYLAEVASGDDRTGR
jgi:hypothetical protein